MIRKAVGAIIFQGDKFLIVYKTKINTHTGKENIPGEWDFIKGGVKDSDIDISHSLIRELEEETGSTNYRIIKQFGEKICFIFPEKIKRKIGYERQETTMFHVEYMGDIRGLSSIDNEISEIQFVEKDKVLEVLTHEDTKDFFMRHCTD